MFELHQVGAQSYFIESPAKIGLYAAAETDVYLIDSGNDKDAGRRVRKLLDARGWRLKGILNTHSHADHIGGNRYLQQNLGCTVFCGGIEGAFTEHPVLEPSFLYGGCPPADLRHKFLMAQDSAVLPLTDPAFPREVAVIPLPGHSYDMVGYRTPDGTVFLADCISSAATLEKYQVSFIYDVAAYLQTLDTVERLQAPAFIPAHTEPLTAETLPALVAVNRAKVCEIADKLAALCAAPADFETLLKALFDTYGLTMNFEQYVLVGSTVRSYLAWLKDTGRVSAQFRDNRLLWQTAAPTA